MKTATPSTKFLLSIFLLLPTIVFSQVTELSNTPFNVTDYLGWDASTGLEIPLDIKHMNTNNPQAIQFFTNATQKMMINAGGNVSIGNTNNAYKLDVSGDINIASNQVYRINGLIMLGDKSFGSPRNIFVGQLSGNNIQTAGNTNTIGNTCVGAYTGQSLTANSADAIYNTLIGSSAGAAVTTGQYNTAIGTNSGLSLTTGTYNTFVGTSSGLNCQTGNYNVCVGYNAGLNVSSSENVFVGYHCGRSNTSGTLNTFMGRGAGYSNTLSSYNVFLGYAAGYNIAGSGDENNTFIGSGAGDGGSLVDGDNVTLLGYNAEASNDLTNATAIGANAYVNANHSLILGGITGTNSGTNTNVGIGTTAPTSRLHVVNNAENIAGYFNATYAPMTDIIKGIYNQTSTGDINGVNISLTTSSTTASLANVGYRTSVTSSSTETTQKNYGVFAITSGASIENHAVYGDASSTNNDTGSKNYGGKLFAHKGAAYTPETNYGVWGKGYEAGTNYGGYFIGTDGTTNYGVYATAGSTGTNYAAYFSGDGVLTGSGWSSSDISLKQNIEPIADNLSIISQLQPKKFEFRTNEYPQINLSSGQHYGLIAQELQLVLPDLVRSIIHPSQYDSLGNETFSSMNYLAVNYMELIPFLIGAIKEQQQQIDDLNSRLTSCCGPGIQEFQVPDNGYNQPSTITHQPLASVARDLPVLSQNQPNPFGEKTVIRFYIPKATKDAAIKVFDNTGSVYRLFSITGEGPGAIELEANSLAAGSYYYSLLIGGNVIDTKVMVITK